MNHGVRPQMHTVGPRQLAMRIDDCVPNVFPFKSSEVSLPHDGSAAEAAAPCSTLPVSLGECKLASDWTGPPGDQSIQMSSSTLSLFGVPLLLALARVM